MVYIHFPTKLTDEELMLQTKYAKLRKKKKQVAAHQNPQKNVEAEKLTLVSRFWRFNSQYCLNIKSFSDYSSFILAYYFTSRFKPTLFKLTIALI